MLINWLVNCACSPSAHTRQAEQEDRGEREGERWSAPAVAPRSPILEAVMNSSASIGGRWMLAWQGLAKILAKGERGRSYIERERIGIGTAPG